MKLTLGFSPCPNDCFIFDALVHHKIDTEGLEFEVLLEDVEKLNLRAFQNDLDITKLSYHTYLHVINDYILLKSGGALGFNCGPLLVKRSDTLNLDLTKAKIAIPGKYTTANFLLGLAFPLSTNKSEMIFSEIENAVIERKVDAGLIIHESRFTYNEKGLEKICDLGEFWNSLIQAPIPLGGIVARREYDIELLQKINRIIHRSITHAFSRPDSAMPYVRKYAQEMDEVVMKQHINLYVNEYSLDLGVKGKTAVELMFHKAVELNYIEKNNLDLIIK